MIDADALLRPKATHEVEDSIIRHYVLRICIYAVQHMDLHFPLALADTPANEDQGQFSPDGRWVAYTSNESGLSEIYVIPFPPTPNGGRWMVSRGGGVQPRWRRDGRELFYISPDWTMMAVPVNSTPVFHAGTPQALFNTDMVDTGIRTGPMRWDIAPDGKRFLIISDKSQGASSLNVMLNWRPKGQK
jgi:Tol biopolymer transport system component